MRQVKIIEIGISPSQTGLLHYFVKSFPLLTLPQLKSSFFKVIHPLSGNLSVDDSTSIYNICQFKCMYVVVQLYPNLNCTIPFIVWYSTVCEIA